MRKEAFSLSSLNSAEILIETVCCTIVRSDQTSGFKPITMLAKITKEITAKSNHARDLMKIAENPSSLQKVSKAPVNLQNAVWKPSSLQKVTKGPVSLQTSEKKPSGIQKMTPAAVQLQTAVKKLSIITKFTKNNSQISSILSNSGLPLQKTVKKLSPIHKSTKSISQISSILSTSGLPHLHPNRSFSSIAGLLKEPDGCHTILDEPSREQRIKRITKGLQVDPSIAEKILEYSQLQPTPISIEEFVARGKFGAVSEVESYTHLVHEVTVRLSHMLMEMQSLPQQLKVQEPARDTIKLYVMSFTEILQFEGRDPTCPWSPTVLSDFMETLKRFKKRHRDTVVEMANAIKSMRADTIIDPNSGMANAIKSMGEDGYSIIDPNSGLANCVQYYLDRLYMSRISIHMITNQHLMVYGGISTPPGQIGVIDPKTYVTSILVDAYDDARFLCEQSFMVVPKIIIKNHNTINEDSWGNNSVVCAHIPAHMYHIFFEVIKNAMRATVEHHWDNQDDMPPINVLVCQTNDDVTVKISDQGGGMDRETVERKIFQYLYTSSPHDNVEVDYDLVPMFGLGYGLPLSRLYAKYFRGDLKVASYEGYGTDAYIYLHNLSRNAREQLPVYNTTSTVRMTNLDTRGSGWTSNARFNNARITENFCIRN